MKSKILAFSLLFSSILFAQEQTDNSLVKEIPTIQKKLEKQRIEIETQNLKLQKQTVLIEVLTKKLENLNTSNESISKLTETNRTNITSIADDLGTKIQQTETSSKNSISKLDKDVNTNRLYWIIATLITLLLGGLVYWLIGKRILSSQTDVETQIKSSQTDVETQIRNTKKSLEEESLKLDSKLIEVLETQFKLQQEENKNQPVATAEKSDHSLALKVADEIVRMHKNISKMDSNIKGLKPLEKGIERIQSNFAANGYEMINLLNQEYDERINCDVINFTTDETLPNGKRIINAIIKPQVNYNGVLIQRAQVDVSQN